MIKKIALMTLAATLLMTSVASAAEANPLRGCTERSLGLRFPGKAGAGQRFDGRQRF